MSQSTIGITALLLGISLLWPLVLAMGYRLDAPKPMQWLVFALWAGQFLATLMMVLR